jgi:hypothetical protein
MKFTELTDFLNNKIPINLFYKNIKNEISIYRSNFINKKSSIWKEGRPAPFLQAEEILKSNPKISVDPLAKSGFYKYESGGLEMIYNPTTKEIWHLQPSKK